MMKARNILRILGVPIDQVDMSAAVATILKWAECGEENYVCIRDVHGAMLTYRDPQLREIHERAGLVTPDGMPLVWISKLKGSLTIKRVCGSDLVDALCDASQEADVGHFFYGGRPGVAEKMAEALKKKYSRLNVVGTFTPPFRSLTAEEDRDVVAMISSSGAKIVWVGISTPRQELWMRDHVGAIPQATLIGVGAAFDFHSGMLRRAPKWMQKAGVEWMFRLLTEPRRLWRRYVLLAPLFVWKWCTLELFGSFQSRPFVLHQQTRPRP